MRRAANADRTTLRRLDCRRGFSLLRMSFSENLFPPFRDMGYSLAMNSGSKEARELLAFYLDAGADALLGEEPVDRMADESFPPPIAAPPPVRRDATAEPLARKAMASTQQRPPTQPAAPASPEVAAMAAREAAKSAQTLDELRGLLERFDGCALRATATQLVFADGNPQGRVMFVGEAPGYEEDVSGKPFVGRSGKLLDLMIGAIGLDRSTAYIANVVPWRPPGNRTPTPQETAICLPFIRRQIELADPDILVCLGGPAMQTLLNIKDGITRSRGRWFPYDTGKREIKALATFHPAFLLRSPLQKRFAWRDFLALKKALAAGASS
jgi:uracil-DNA glycosylase